MPSEIANTLDRHADSSLRPMQTVTKPPPWHLSVVLDLFLSGLAAGAFILAALGELTNWTAFSDISRIIFLCVFPISLIDFASLIVDLGHPARFHHMLRIFSLRSPMSTGVWVLSVFAVVAFFRFSIAAASMFVSADLLDSLARIVDVFGILPALFVSAYKGVLLSVTAQPGWRRARWLGALMSISAGAMGAAVMLLIAVSATAAPAANASRVALCLLLAAEIVASVVVRSEMGPDILGAGKVSASQKLYTVLVPMASLIALAIAVFSRAPSLMIVAALLTITNALAFRRHLIMIPHEVE